jgi:DNA-binding transcriptional MerR regulator
VKDFGLKKLYYSISEVSRLTKLEQYTLRYWESEFKQLNPAKNRAGNRIYTNQDIELILKIKHLLKDKKYTFEGARKVLETEKENLPVKEKKKKGIKPQLNKEPVPKSVPKTNLSKDEEIEILKKDLVDVKNFLLLLRSKL